MLRLKHSRLRYRKYYFLLILTLFSICLIIYYGIIDHNEDNFMLLTFFNDNDNNNFHRQYLSKKHVQVGSNKKLRDWHNYTQSSRSITRDLHQQHKIHQQQLQLPQQQKQQPQQHTIFNLDKFGQMAITNSTSELKLIEQNEKSLQLTGFNMELSESLPLQRLIPDTRHKM